MAVQVTQDDSDWVEFSCSQPEVVATNKSTMAAAPCCVFTTNLHTTGCPELLAVDCESEARETVEQCMTFVANFMYNSDKVVPHLFRFTLQLDDPLHTCYFCVLQVKDPVQVKTLQEKYMDGGSTTDDCDCADDYSRSSEMLLLLMPIIPRSKSAGAMWGRLPPPPSNNLRMRNHVKQVLEDQHASPCGFLRVLPGGGGGKAARGGGRKKKKRKRETNAMGRVKLCDALAHPEWKVQWDTNLKTRDIDYMKKHSKHFLAMSIDGVSPQRAVDYIAALVKSGDHWRQCYKQGKLIESSTTVGNGAD